MSYNDHKDNLKRYTRKNALEICGIPGEAYTWTVDMINKLGKQLQVPILPEDIDMHKNCSLAKIIKKMNTATTPKNRQLSLLATAQVQPKWMKFKSLQSAEVTRTKNRNIMDYPKLLLQTSNDTSQ